MTQIDSWMERKRVLRMKKNMRLLTACLLVVFLTGCGGPSREKIEEVQNIYAQLVNKHNEVIEVYANIEDDSFSKELDQMAENINSIGQQDMKSLTNEEIEEIADELQQNITMYNDILSSIEKIVDEKEEVKELLSVPVTIQNNTGIKLYQIYLYQAGQEDKGDNLAADIEYLDGYQTLNILNIYMEETETLWYLEAMDEEGNTIEAAEVDFSGMTGKDVTIRMNFSFDTMEGWLELE